MKLWNDLLYVARFSFSSLIRETERERGREEYASNILLVEWINKGACPQEYVGDTKEKLIDANRGNAYQPGKESLLKSI